MPHARFVVALSSFALLGLLMAGSLAAAQRTPMLHGMVKDDTGGALVGVTIELDAGPGRTYTIQTDGTGHYAFLDVVPGLYTVSFTL
ncbi:MAG: carboxypeptidase regulatory-like domain-containing protein, partial [Acidobacteria bacterium]|nr:carboxypeptidase regulatory-like domain-containing protein [Acidobacteriota bacterium]